MDSLLFWIIGFSAFGGVLSVLAAASFLLLPATLRARLLPSMVSFAIGALLGAAFLAILPHAFETPNVPAHNVTLTVLLGILSFFLLEKTAVQQYREIAELLGNFMGDHGDAGDHAQMYVGQERRGDQHAIDHVMNTVAD